MELAQRVPRGVRDHVGTVKLVGGAKQRRLQRTPPRRARSDCDISNLGVREPLAAGCAHMLGPLVLGAAQPSDPQDEDLAHAA